ncbi:hypothetical protein UFOVP54_72 [uncultured Caudovirales phage]|uniref:Uncharacterized protein n=1 Tax=uncultured Caudovirales phage TaxID=2100421 RepID=A0A6J5KV03_9CAUD|nr:hypothetical protein UFOVP54_72 [uncultured Caudovirales phage]
MGAYKKLNKQDAYITTYVAHKPWSVGSDGYTTYGITVNSVATTGNGNYLNSIKQLYYPSKSLDGSGNTISHSFDYYEQTTLFNSNYRNLPTEGYSPNILSIPRALYGISMQPGTVALEWSGRIDFIRQTGTFVDDGEGGIYLSGSSPKSYIGDIIYPHGVVVITGGQYTTVGINNVAFNSSQPIYTYNYHCKIRESEYNYTYNPSALSGSLKTIYNNSGNVYSTSGSVSDGVLKDNVTGSSFQPYITTVGLYNDANELIAVGKMGQPVPKPANTEMTIIVKIDI